MSSKWSKTYSSLLKFHRPTSSSGSTDGHNVLTDETRKCLQNLLYYRPKISKKLKYPRSRTAAVLVCLFVGRKGQLYVLLSQRSATLRSYAGDTSLPGGKSEKRDRSLEDTARREAFEEIGLSLDKRKVPLLCIMEPFIAGNLLVVTPVVVLITDMTLRPILNQPEVSSLFSHPLKSLLSTEAPNTLEPHVDEVPYHTYTDIPWLPADRNRFIRMHRFLTGREAGGIKPIYGLTAAILIRVATIAFGREPEFEVMAARQPSNEERIEYALKNSPDIAKANEEERNEEYRSTRSRL